MKDKVQHLASIQILRAVAASIVLLAHQWAALAQVGAPDAIYNWASGAFGVDLFFVISGFIMVYTSEPLFGRRDAPRIFIGRRLLRIVPLYWFLTLAIVIGWYFYFGYQLPWHTSWKDVIASLLFIPLARVNGETAPVLGIGWTLNYEMFFYFFFALATPLRRMPAVIAVSAVLLAFTALPFTKPPMSVWGSSLVWEFIFGMWIGLAYRARWRVGPVVAYIAAAIGFAAAAYTHSFTVADYPRALLWGIPAFVVVAAVALCRIDLGKPRVLAPLVALGDASYALYLVHPLVPVAMRLGRVPAVIDPVQHGYVYATVSVIFSIFAAFVLNAVDKRFRLLVLARKRKRRTVSKAAVIFDRGH